MKKALIVLLALPALWAMGYLVQPHLGWLEEVGFVSYIRYKHQFPARDVVEPLAVSLLLVAPAIFAISWITFSCWLLLFSSNGCSSARSDDPNIREFIMGVLRWEPTGFGPSRRWETTGSGPSKILGFVMVSGFVVVSFPLSLVAFRISGASAGELPSFVFQFSLCFFSILGKLLAFCLFAEIARQLEPTLEGLPPVEDLPPERVEAIQAEATRRLEAEIKRNEVEANEPYVERELERLRAELIERLRAERSKPGPSEDASPKLAQD